MNDGSSFSAPIDISYDWSSTLGGPVKRDKVWFFGATRRWRLDQLQIGALNADGSQAIDDAIVGANERHVRKQRVYERSKPWSARTLTLSCGVLDANIDGERLSSRRGLCCSDHLDGRFLRASDGLLA